MSTDVNELLRDLYDDSPFMRDLLNGKYRDLPDYCVDGGTCDVYEGWYDDGSLRYRFQTKNNYLHGEFIMWDEQGIVIYDETYVNGRPK
jgi:hypothetical protein